MRRQTSMSLINSPTDPPAENLEEASKQIMRYIENHLPRVIEVDLIPLCFDLTALETQIIIGGRQGNIVLFDLVSSKTIKDIELCSCPITSILFAMADSIVVASNQVMCLYILSFPTLDKIFSLPLGPERLMICLGFNSESIFIANCTETVTIYSLANIADAPHQLESRSIILGQNVICMDLSEDASLVAFGLNDSTIQLYHGESESMLQTSPKLEGKISHVRFSHNKKLIAVVLSTKKVEVFSNCADFTLKYSNDSHKRVVNALTFVRDDRFLITGGEDSLIVMHDLKVERSPYYLELFDYSIYFFKTSRDRRKLFYSQNANKIMIWEAPMLSKNARYRKHTGKVNAIVFLPNSFELLSVGQDGLAILWDCRNDTVQEILDVKRPLRAATVSSTSKFCFISLISPSIIRWNLCSFKYTEYELISPVHSMRLSKDEELLALSDELYRIIVYSTIDMERKYIIKGHTSLVTDTAFIKSNSVIMSSSQDHSLAQWSLKTLEKVTSFYGHSAPVLCMLVMLDETMVLSGSADKSVIVWSIEGVLMYTLMHQSPLRSIFVTEDKKYIITTEDSVINYWQFSNLTLVLNRDLNNSQCVDLSLNEKTIATAQGNTIFIEENPLKSETLDVVGRTRGSSHKFMNYVYQLLTDSIRSEYLDIYSHWIFTPYVVGIAHLLSYKNKYDILYKTLIESEHKASFCFTVKEESPLSISVEMDHKSCIEICLKYLKKEFSNKNKLAFVPLGRCLTKINRLDISSIPKLYESLFARDDSIHLPNYCADGTLLPKINYSDSNFINVDTLLPKEAVATHGQSIVFYHSLCPLILETGTTGSIEFLESLLNCGYQEIFRSKFLQVLLRDKWQIINWAIYAQGLLYILYLVLLSFYCISFQDSTSYLFILFIAHVLLFLYEVIQIATDKYDYWKDVWNILDQLRGITFTLYAVLYWLGDNNGTILLIVIIFSWTRGISYFRMFEGTRYMVRLLSEVIKDMQVFFIILFYSTLAFSFILFLENPEKYPFSKYVTVSYRLDLGDFESDYETVFEWMIFFLATVINPLIMLNLLISIMGDTYSKVQETNDIANFQELIEMIIEIEKLMFWKRNFGELHYIHQCDYLKGSEGGGDKLNEKMKFMKGQLNSIQNDVRMCYEEIKKNNELTQSLLAQNQEIISRMMLKGDNE